MTTIALLGGEPVRRTPFPAYNVIGEDEIKAVRAVMETGVLSKYIGAEHEDFMGGPQVRAFEAEWAAAFDVDHAIAVNSATSGLFAAIGATGVGPGDEVIVPPLSMAASATAPVVYGAVPVFCDVDANTFNPDPVSIAEKITERTKAIIVVHLLGHPTDMNPVKALADRCNLVVIEDCAQAIYASYYGCNVGTLADIGVFSLNYHKHIHTGEGGVCVTNDKDLAERLRLIRNHAEAVAAGRPGLDLTNLIGFNFRMGEIEAAIGRSLLPKARDLIEKRRANIRILEQMVGDLPGLSFTRTAEGCVSSYYAHGLLCDQETLGVSRDLLVEALRAELPITLMREEAGGALIGPGYSRPLYMLPMYQEMIAIGRSGFPFRGPQYAGKADYRPNLFPRAEQAARTMITHEMMRPPMTESDLRDVADAFHKVYENLDALRDWRTRRLHK